MKSVRVFLLSLTILIGLVSPLYPATTPPPDDHPCLPDGEAPDECHSWEDCGWVSKCGEEEICCGGNCAKPSISQFCCNGEIHDIDESELSVNVDASPVVDVMLGISSAIVNAAEPGNGRCKIPEKPQTSIAVKLTSKNACCDDAVKRINMDGSIEFTFTASVADCRIPVPVGGYKGIYIKLSGGIDLQGTANVYAQTCTIDSYSCVSGTISANGMGVLGWDAIPGLISIEGGASIAGSVTVEKCFNGTSASGGGCIKVDFKASLLVFDKPLMSYSNTLYQKCAP